ncbi:Rrf2 family transcriptional regulator [Candidatus Aerophobetes bacterium]|uniref:Rrf2 family transcriptional regulator n=1 Tax=Aerophobetes bacterium TaxID=2030807 RepID=A0A523QH14_UNCAE|nr:MAG: Rrf2 family transcriptional regulator [Candidatus Aerophobetes bacterium]
MKLNTQIRFGVRALFDIAYHNNGGPTRIASIAKRQKLSPDYLEQIFKKLRNTRILEGKKGPGGGYYLARRPEKITLREVIQAIDGPIDLVFCVGQLETGVEKCSLSKKCITTYIWKELSDNISTFFDSITISDLCRRAEKQGIIKEPDV